MTMNKLLKGLLGAAVTVAMFGTVNAQAQTGSSSGIRWSMSSYVPRGGRLPPT